MDKIHISFKYQIPAGPDDFDYETVEDTFKDVDDAIAFLGTVKRMSDRRKAEIVQVEEPD